MGGFVQLAVTPAGAGVTLTTSGGSPRPVQPGRLALPAGEYVFTASLPGQPSQTAGITVRGGQTAPVTFNFRIQERKSEVRESSGMKDLAGPWEKQNEDWFTLKGDQQSLFALSAKGTHVFKVRRRGGLGPFVKGKARILTNYRNTGNYVLFEIEEGNIDCTEFVNGKGSKKGKQAIDKNVEEVRFDVTPNRITVTLGAKQIPYSASDFSAADFTEGRFGFRGPIGIKDFAFRGGN
jgi:hypothetical protein